MGGYHTRGRGRGAARGALPPSVRALCNKSPRWRQQTQAELPEESVCVCLWGGETDTTEFFISLLALFAHYPTQFHQLSISHFVSKEAGSTPSFFIVWTMVQANLGEVKHFWIRINLEQASRRHSPLMLQTKAWDALTILRRKHFFFDLYSS